MDIILDRYTIYLNNPEDDCKYFETYGDAKSAWDKIILQHPDATMTKWVSKISMGQNNITTSRRNYDKMGEQNQHGTK